MATKTAAKAKIAKKTAEKESTDLYTLIEESRILDENEREFWLANFQALDEISRGSLIKNLKNAEKELRAEIEAHTRRLAEINAKAETNLKELIGENGTLLAAEKEFKSAKKDGGLVDDDFLDELAELGELN